MRVMVARQLHNSFVFKASEGQSDRGCREGISRRGQREPQRYGASAEMIWDQ